MALNKDEYYEEKWVGRKLLYRLHPAFDWREMPYDELCSKICDLENELKRVMAETSEREQANDNIPLVIPVNILIMKEHSDKGRYLIACAILDAEPFKFSQGTNINCIRLYFSV